MLQSTTALGASEHDAARGPGAAVRCAVYPGEHDGRPGLLVTALFVILPNVQVAAKQKGALQTKGDIMWETSHHTPEGLHSPDSSPNGAVRE